MSRQSPPKDAQNNRANQLNPQHPAYYRSRGATTAEAEQAATRAKAEQATRQQTQKPEPVPALGPEVLP